MAPRRIRPVARTKEIYKAFARYVRAGRLALSTLRRDPRAFLAHAEAKFAAADPTAEREVVDSLPNVVPVNFAIVQQLGSPYLNVMIPGMAMWAMSGGPNTALNLTYRLAREGVPIRYVSTDIPPDSDHDPLWDHLQTLANVNQRLSHVQIVSGRDPSAATKIGRDDLFFGTAWWTVQMIKHALPTMRHRRFIYFIQDFEAAFYPWSTIHALALETYDLDFVAIVNETLLLDHLVEQRIGRFANPEFAADCVAFEPAVDRSLFHPEPRSDERSKTLLFYARPDAPRNLYELGLVALKRAAERGAFSSGRWDLYFMGERGLPPARLTPDIVIKPLDWMTYREYAELLRRSDVGLALMLSPHSGYPALEMAASGMHAITNTYSVKTRDRLQAISPNITAVRPVVEDIVDAIERVVARAEQDDSRNVHIDTFSLASSWDDVFEPIIPRLIETIEAIAGRRPSHT